MQAKYFLLLFLFFVSLGIKAQDTTVLLQYPDGGKLIEVRTAKDTFQLGFYAENKLESSIRRDPKTNKTHYIRYYRNGKIMWNKQLLNQMEHGTSIYYNTSGKRVAEFNFISGNIKDTLFLMPNTYLLFGNLSYSSIVYGGMENEDGSSNVSEMSGPYMHVHMKFIPLDKKNSSKPIPEYYFTSDHLGNFFVVLKPGKYGLFDKNFKVKDLQEDQFAPDEKNGMSWNAHWDLRGPVIIQPSIQILFINFRHSSVGYAP